MSSKNSTNKVVILVIVGLILAQSIGGLMGGFIGNIFFGTVMMLVIFSGVFGKKALERVCVIGIALTVGMMIATNEWGGWWLYILGFLIALFFGSALSNHRPNHKQELLDYETELRYELMSKEDNFTIRFPAKPKLTKDSLNLTQSYKYNWRNNASYNILITNVESTSTPKEVNWEFLESQLEHSHEARIFAGGYKFAGKDLNSEKTEIFGIPCLKATIKYENGHIYYEVLFVNGDKLYEVYLELTKKNDVMFDKFIGSFRFLK